MQVINKMLNLYNINHNAMRNDDLILLAEYNTAFEAEMAKSMLENAGIEAVIEDDLMSSIYPTGIIPTKLLVREADARQAQQLIAQH